MDETIDKLASLIKDRQLDHLNGQVDEIIRRAQAEAFPRVEAILTEVMVQVVLEQALDRLSAPGKSPVFVEEVARQPSKAGIAATNVGPSPIAQTTTKTTEDEERVQREMGVSREEIATCGSPSDQAGMPGPFTEAGASQDTQGDEGEYGYYVYGVVGGNSSEAIQGLPGVDPSHPVYTLPHRAIQAVVSKVPLQEFGAEELAANVDDMQWLEAKVRAHQRVLEATLSRETLIPMRFCTIYDSESRVREVLDQYHADFVAGLTELDGKREWGVKIFCDGKALVQKIDEVSEKVRELNEEIEQQSSAVAYFLKKTMEETVSEEMERICDECAQLSHDRLSSHAQEAIANPLQDREITGRGEAMLLNGAYLVAEDCLTAFRAELERLENDYGDRGFIYEMTGPWPSYNFVSIGLEEMAVDE